MANIKVDIDGGKFPPVIKFELEGMKGTGCTSLADEFSKATRLVTQHQTLKPEYKEVKQKLTARR